MSRTDFFNIDRRALLSIAAGISVVVAGCTSHDEEAPEDDDEEAPEDDDEEAPEDEDEDEEDEDEEIEAEILASDQVASDELKIDRVETEAEATLEILDEAGNSLAPGTVIRENEVLEDYSVEYSSPIEQRQEVSVELVHDDYGTIATAAANIEPDLKELVKGDILFIEANSDRGFNYPYYAYIPEDIRSNGPVFVEPNNTGTSTDEFNQHEQAAEDILDPDGHNRELVEELRVPILVPVFPRPESDPVDWTNYTHALDAETMAIDDGDLERIDLQLIEMVDHYRASLKTSLGYEAAEEFHLNGFSASGNFVNRFTALQPERVRAATAGGVNGTLILPKEEENGQSLPYPIGVDNIEDLTGDEFDKEVWVKVPQFIYLGEEDENDTIPYDDAWNAELREIALDVYGDDMQKDRMPYCSSVYKEADANAQIHTYTNYGHSIPRPVRRDLYEFHLNHIEEGSSFDPIETRDPSTLNISFDTQPEGGDTEITVEIHLKERFKIDDKFSDGTISVMLDSGEEIDWGDHIDISGETHFRARDLPINDTFTYSVERTLETGEELTVGIMDGNILTSETVTVE